MIILTNSAGALLERVQTEQALPHALRLELEAGSDDFSMGLTDPAPDDAVLYHEETPVLYVSAPAAEALGDCTVSTQETPQGTTLTVARGNG